jgi:hypothetical protein
MNRPLPSLLGLLALLPACTDPTRKPAPADVADPAADTGPRADTASAPGSPDTAAGDTAPAESGAPDTAPDSASAETGAAEACTSYADPVARGTVADGALDELSDLVPSRKNPGILWTHEDSGGDAALYALDPSGATVGTLTIDGADNHDWEDMAVAPCPDGSGDCLWIGDTGDNALGRDDVAVLVVPEPVVAGPFAAHATPTTYRYTFPDGRGNVEGLAIDPTGLPVLVTKRVDGTADVYRFPTLDAAATVTLDPLGRIPTGDPSDEHPAEATSADIRPDGSRLLVRTYGSLFEYPLTGALGEGRTALPAPVERPGEAAGYDPAGGVWLVSEGASATIWFVGCADGRR